MVIEQRRELLELLQRQIQQEFTFVNAVQHCLTDDLMRLAERQTFAYQEVSDISCIGKVRVDGFTHPALVHLHRRNHWRKQLECPCKGGYSVEHALFVFLHIFVVCQRQGLEHRQQPDQVAVDTARLAPHQLRHIRVLLLRHNAAACAEGIIQLHEAELRAAPQHQFFTQPGQVSHHQCRVGQKFDDEIPVADRIQTVLIDTIEPELLCYKMTVDREGGSRKRPCSQRQHVDPLVAVRQAFCITAEHGHVSQQMVGEQDRLGTLQMRVAGNDRLDIVLGLAYQRFLQLMQQSYQFDHPIAQIQMHVGSHLVVAAASGMQLAADRADLLDQIFFNIHMNIFICHGKNNLPRTDFVEHLVQSVLDRLYILLRQDAAFAQHCDMGQTSLHILFSK
ncbi:hypothetical protein D3C73_513810 [compost metagenome]